MGDISERCLAMIAKQKSLPAEAVQLSQTLEELHFDSLDKVTLVFDIEEEFHLAISDEEVASLRSVADIIQGVEKKVAELA